MNSSYVSKHASYNCCGLCEHPANSDTFHKRLLNISFETWNVLETSLLSCFLNVCLLSLFTQDFKRFNETSFKHLAKIFIKCFIWDIYYMCKASSTIHMYYTCIWRQLLDVCWRILCPDKVKNCSWDITFCVALYTVFVI